LRGIKTILFDLDGTVYQDNNFHRTYLSILVRNTLYAPWEERLIDLADGILGGKYIPMNRFYRAGVRPVNRVDDVLDALQAGELKDLSFTEAYKAPLPDTHFLGDAWAVVSLLAQTLRLSRETQDKTFREVRGLMLHDVIPNPGLIEALNALKPRYVTILLSNSPPDTAGDFIRRLGLEHAFTHIGYGSGKPYGLAGCLERFAPDALEDPRSLLSIGDHVFNEIENVRLLGGRTLWICFYPHISYEGCGLRLRTVEELREFLEALP
jgi:FMN phosphatase YigB (HAD superfamily)